MLFRFKSLTGLKHANKSEFCQDWSTAEKITNDILLGVISDGCTSSTHAEIGSAIWGQTATDLLKKDPSLIADKTEFAKLLIKVAAPVIQKINYKDGFATLICCVLNKQTDEITINLYGDGILAYRFKNSDIIHALNYYHENNAPLYLNYFLSNKEFSEWSKELTPLIVAPKKISIQGNCLVHGSSTKINQSDMDIGVQLKLKLSDCSEVLIASDGMSTFSKPKNALNSKLAYVSEWFNHPNLEDTHYLKNIPTHKDDLSFFHVKF